MSSSGVDGFERFNPKYSVRTHKERELEHENETLKRMNSCLQSKVMARDIIIRNLRKEIEDHREEIAKLKKRPAHVSQERR